MLLTITNTQPPATDLGYLLHKNPARLQTFDLSFGRAHVIYPEATEEKCSAALLLEVDPVGLVRNRRRPRGEGYALEQYVNDRPYVASSFLSVAIAQVFRSALGGQSKERKSLVDARLPLKAAISVLPCRGGEEFLRRLFEPLGYIVTAVRQVLVVTAIKGYGARRVLDLGCGEGKLLRALLDEQSFTEVAGVDVSYRALEITRDRLKLDRLSQKQRDRIRLMHGSLTYRDKRLSGYDAATVVEVIEHLDPPRLSAFEHVLFEFARPGTVVMTTPNFEYNVKFENQPSGQLRHRDHRFEWTRSEFEQWAKSVADRFGYSVSFAAIGPEDEVTGAPTQMAVFTVSRIHRGGAEKAEETQR